MQELQTVLIILLSIGFGILLLMGIAMVFIIVNILNNVRRITQRVDETSENMGEMAKYMGKKVAPAAVGALMRVALRGVKSKVKKDK